MVIGCHVFVWAVTVKKPRPAVVISGPGIRPHLVLPQAPARLPPEGKTGLLRAALGA